MSDQNTDEAKAIIELANFRLARWTDRRKHEWTISAGLWIALGGAGLSGKLKSMDPISLASILIIFVIAHAILWVRFNLTRNQRDLSVAFDYINQAHKRLLTSDPPAPPECTEVKRCIKQHCPMLEFLVEPPCLFEILLSVIVALFVFLNRNAI